MSKDVTFTYNMKSVTKGLQKLSTSVSKVSQDVVTRITQNKAHAFAKFDEVEATPYAVGGVGKLMISGPSLEVSLQSDTLHATLQQQLATIEKDLVTSLEQEVRRIL